MVNSFTTVTPVPPEEEAAFCSFFALPHWHTHSTTHRFAGCPPRNPNQHHCFPAAPFGSQRNTEPRDFAVAWDLGTPEGLQSISLSNDLSGAHQPLKRGKTYTYRHLEAPSVSRRMLTEQLHFFAGHKPEVLLCLELCKERMVLDYSTSLLCPLAPRCSALKGNISSPLGKLQKNVAVTHINYTSSCFRTQ